MGGPNNHEEPNVDFLIGDSYPLSADHQSCHSEVKSCVNPSNATRPHGFTYLALTIPLGPRADSPDVVAVQLERTISVGRFVPDE
jgi:hypothetical protein